MYKVIVSGATSFLGLEVTKQLSENGNFVYALIRKGAKREYVLQGMPSVKIVEYTLEKIWKIREEISEQCDVFIHLAWAGIRGRDRDDVELQKNNYTWTDKAFSIACKLGCSVFVLAGSQAEYGVLHDSHFHENLVCNPITEYGKQKVRLFKHLTIRAKNNRIRLLEPRFFSVYGPYDYAKSMVMSTIRKMLKSEECLFTEAIQIWDFLYVSDAVRAVIMLIENKAAEGTYNIAFGHGEMLRDYIDIMKRVLNSDSILQYGAISYNKSVREDLRADISKLVKATGWKPEVPFEKGIILTRDFLLNKD